MYGLHIPICYIGMMLAAEMMDRENIQPNTNYMLPYMFGTLGTSLDFFSVLPFRFSIISIRTRFIQ